LAKPAAAASRSPEPRFIPPYPPSWFDRLKGLIERLPIPWWLFYLIFSAVSILVFLSVQARAGAYDDGFFAWHLFLASQPAFVLAAVHYLSQKPRMPSPSSNRRWRSPNGYRRSATG